MNKQEIIQIANKFKVALPVFSLKMPQSFEAPICWDINILDNTGRYNVIDLKFHNDKFTFKVPAPTMQDVMNLLPQNIEDDTTYSLVVNKYSVFYENSLGHTKHNFMVANHNIVNALCELYVALKSAKVII